MNCLSQRFGLRTTDLLHSVYFYKMKFTIAAGILVAQLLPAVSDDSAAVAAEVFSLHEEGSNQQDLDLQQKILSNVRHSPKLQRLKNKHAITTSMAQKNCDPSSDDVDVGVLSCDLGYDCVPHESSALGGLCVSSARELQAVEYCDLCGYGSTVGYSKYSIATGYQDFTCGDLSFASYGDNVTLTTEQCAGTAQLAKSAGCCVSYDCDPCGDMTFNGNLTFGEPEPIYLCGAFTPLLNETSCAYYTEYLSGPCCESGEAMTPTTAPVSSAGSDIPTMVVPETPTAEVPGTTEAPAPSASATLRLTSTFVSMMGLTAATAGGLLLN
jgi:hypothetical protein